MRRRRTDRPRPLGALVAFASVVAGVGLASAACSAIIGLDPPPGTDGGELLVGQDDGSSRNDASLDGGTEGDSATDADGIAPVDAGLLVCAPLSASDGFHPLSQGPVDEAGTPAWDFFDTTSITGVDNTFSGGAFDGRYVYLAARGQWLLRYDATAPAAEFASGAAWSGVRLSSIAPAGSITGGFLGAVFDGRYVYFVPFQSGSAPGSVAARFDTSAADLGDAAAWSSFDLASLTGSGVSTKGFSGGVFDGRYVYFVPRNDGVPDGRVVRYDTRVSDAGDAAAAGFADSAQWSTFDVGAANPTAIGFLGGIFDGTDVYLVPSVNDAYDASVDNGGSGIIARRQPDAAASSAVTTFDLTRVNGQAESFFGGAFDGRYLYLVPRTTGLAVQYDTTNKASFATVAGWSDYDLSRAISREGGALPTFAGAAFDGRFVYYVPTTTTFDTVARYDTRSSFRADCAWSTVDLTQLAPADASAQNFLGAVFDGTYVYFVPLGNVVARFNARSTPAPAPFVGSFL